jgi:hypothetical protein
MPWRRLCVSLEQGSRDQAVDSEKKAPGNIGYALRSFPVAGTKTSKLQDVRWNPDPDGRERCCVTAKQARSGERPSWAAPSLNAR